MTAVQGDLLAEPTPPAPTAIDPLPQHLTDPGTGRAYREARNNRLILAESLRFAVPIHMLELRDVPADRRRHYLPPGGLEALGFGDVLMFKGQRRQTAARAFDAYARALAALAYQPGGVTLFGAHFCVAPHDGCPRDWTPRPPIAWPAVNPLDELEALIAAEEQAS